MLKLKMKPAIVARTIPTICMSMYFSMIFKVLVPVVAPPPAPLEALKIINTAYTDAKANTPTKHKLIIKGGLLAPSRSPCDVPKGLCFHQGSIGYQRPTVWAKATIAIAPAAVKPWKTILAILLSGLPYTIRSQTSAVTQVVDTVYGVSALSDIQLPTSIGVLPFQKYWPVKHRNPRNTEPTKPSMKMTYVGQVRRRFVTYCFRNAATDKSRRMTKRTPYSRYAKMYPTEFAASK